MTLRKEDIETLERLLEDKSGAQRESDASAYQKILESSSNWDVKYPGDSIDSFDEILKRTKLNKSTGGKNLIWLKVAASIALIVISTFFLLQYQDTVEISHHLQGTIEVYLPDSSKVTLDKHSSISYKMSDWESGKRQLEFEGLGLFEVQHGSDFDVFTKNGQVTVLGTVFEISDRDSNYEVACYSGKVRVRHQESSVVLTKGLRTELHQKAENLKSPLAFDAVKGKEWLAGIYNYQNENVAKIFSEIERQFDVSINWNPDTARFYTGQFQNSDLNSALRNICLPMGLQYKIENEKTIIIY